MERKFNGIKKVVSSINSWKIGSGMRTQVMYDVKNDKVVYSEHAGQSFTVYGDDFMFIGFFDNTYSKVTMNDIKAAIEKKLQIA